LHGNALLPFKEEEKIKPSQYSKNITINWSIQDAMSDRLPEDMYITLTTICAGSRVARIDPLRFLAGYRTRPLNHVLSLSLVFECVCCAVK